MIALDTGIALVTVPEVQTLLLINSVLENEALERMHAYINNASQFIMNMTGRKFIKPAAAIVERFPGNGQSEHRLRYAPIVGTPATLQYLTHGETETWTSTTAGWTYDADDAKIWFIDGTTFWPDINEMRSGNWRITYNYGYVVADVPFDLKLACIDYIGAIKRQYEENLHGIKSQGLQYGSATAFETEKLPLSVRIAIEKYRRKFD